MNSKETLIAYGICVLIGAFSTAGVFAESQDEKTPNFNVKEIKLYKLASKGQLTAELIFQFYEYAEAKARKQIKAPDEFWDWVCASEQLRRGLLVGLHPDYNPYVIKHLRELRGQFPAEVERYPHLALAFSFVYGAAKDESIRDQGLSSWVGKNRDVPTCVESFSYYAKYSKLMLMPLDELAWPLLLYAVDNDIPIDERKWVLQHYKGRTLKSLRRIHGDPDYVDGKNVKKILGMPGYSMALPRILKDGGVCSQLSYYASRAFKSLGVPSVRLGIPGHVFEGWATGYPEMTVDYGASKGRRDGGFFCPLNRTRKKQYEFEMLVSAMNISYEKYLRALTGNHIITLLPDKRKKDGVELLDKAIECSPYCTENWLTVIELCRDGVLSVDDGWKLIKKTRILVPNQPDVACGIIEAIWGHMVNASMTDPSSKTQQYINRLRGTVNWLDNFNRPELSNKIKAMLKDYSAMAKGKIGTVHQEVVSVNSLRAGSYVWEVLPEISERATLKVSIKHATAGAKGAFHIVAWADTDDDNLPDKQILISPLMQAEKKDQWSSWKFLAKQKKIFIGVAQKTNTEAYYKKGGELKGYCGLSNRVYYSYKFGSPPQKNKRPRYMNLQLEITNN